MGRKIYRKWPNYYTEMEQYKYSQDDDRFHLELTRPVQLEMAGLVDCPKGWMGKNHSHPFWEIIFINRGQGEMKLRNKVCPVQRNELFLIPPLEPHQFTNSGREKVENIYIGFAVDARVPVGEGAETDPILKLDLDDSQVNKLHQLGEAFKSAKSGTASYHDQALIFDIIQGVIDNFSAHPEMSRDSAVDKSGFIAEKAKRYLESNVHKTISVEEVASKFFLSPHYFAKKFKAETGCGIKEYHNQARMKKALELLRDPLLSVSDIADRLGFSNVNYFTNKFREYYLTSPTEQRRKLAEHNQAG